MDSKLLAAQRATMCDEEQLRQVVSSQVSFFKWLLNLINIYYF
jgi:hypothetical protein